MKCAYQSVPTYTLQKETGEGNHYPVIASLNQSYVIAYYSDSISDHSYYLKLSMIDNNATIINSSYIYNFTVRQSINSRSPFTIKKSSSNFFVMWNDKVSEWSVFFKGFFFNFTNATDTIAYNTRYTRTYMQNSLTVVSNNEVIISYNREPFDLEIMRITFGTENTTTSILGTVEGRMIFRHKTLQDDSKYLMAYTEDQGASYTVGRSRYSISNIFIHTYDSSFITNRVKSQVNNVVANRSSLLGDLIKIGDRYVLAWHNFGRVNTGFVGDVLGRIIYVNGSLGQELMLNNQTIRSYGAKITILSNSTFLVTYTVQNNSIQDYRGRVIYNNGTFASEELMFFSYDTDYFQHPVSVASIQSNEIVFAYENTLDSDNGANIWVRHFTFLDCTDIITPELSEVPMTTSLIRDTNLTTNNTATDVIALTPVASTSDGITTLTPVVTNALIDGTIAPDSTTSSSTANLDISEVIFASLIVGLLA